MCKVASFKLSFYDYGKNMWMHIIFFKSLQFQKQQYCEILPFKITVFYIINVIQFTFVHMILQKSFQYADLLLNKHLLLLAILKTADFFQIESYWPQTSEG